MIIYRGTLTYYVGAATEENTASVDFLFRAAYDLQSKNMDDLMTAIVNQVKKILLVKTRITLIHVVPVPAPTAAANPSGNFRDFGFDEAGLRPCADNVDPAYREIAVKFRKSPTIGRFGSMEFRGCLTEAEANPDGAGKPVFTAGATPDVFDDWGADLIDVFDNNGAAIVLPATEGKNWETDARQLFSIKYWKLVMSKTTVNRTSKREKEITNIKAQVSDLTKRFGQAAKDSGKTYNQLDAATTLPFKQEVQKLTTQYTFPVLLRNCPSRKRPMLDYLKS